MEPLECLCEWHEHTRWQIRPVLDVPGDDNEVGAQLDDTLDGVQEGAAHVPLAHVPPTL